MADQLKNMYNEKFIKDFSKIAKEVIPNFDEKIFVKNVINDEWKNLELKQRVRHISLQLITFLPTKFKLAAPLLSKLVKTIKAKGYQSTFIFIFLPDIVELIGAEDPDISLELLKVMTSLSSAEFAIRPFIKNNPEKVLKEMNTWTTSKDEHIRRLASEGCRPRLPWAMGIPYLKQNPEKIIPVLENLKSDPSEYVRRSVANNLNDISKDHPELIITLAKKWFGKNKETDRLLKHACRNLIKSGNQKALTIFGFENKNQIKTCLLKLSGKKFSIGDTLNFDFSFIPADNGKIRLQYIIDFAKSGGKQSKKIFFLSECTGCKDQKEELSKKIKLTHYSTRKLYPGKHHLTITANGVTVADAPFVLE